MAIQNATGELTFGHSNVAQIAVRFFTDSIGTNSTTAPCNFEDLSCVSITHDQASHLEDPVTPDLILKTLKTMKKNKSPGPDGFTVEFFLTTWDIVGPCFCEAIISFFETSTMHRGINSTSIALIPKVQNLTAMGDFRPISLCSIAYKCIAKIIANRIKNVLPNAIDIAQSTFIKGRSISDNILMAQELFRGYSRETGVPKCALKIDLHKPLILYLGTLLWLPWKKCIFLQNL